MRSDHHQAPAGHGARPAIIGFRLSLLSVERKQRDALRLGPDQHFGNDDGMTGCDLVSDVLLHDLRPYIGDRDMRLVLMGWLDKLYDLPEAQMQRVQFRALDRGDDDGRSGEHTS